MITRELCALPISIDNRTQDGSRVTTVCTHESVLRDKAHDAGGATELCVNFGVEIQFVLSYSKRIFDSQVALTRILIEPLVTLLKQSRFLVELVLLNLSLAKCRKEVGLFA